MEEEIRGSVIKSGEGKRPHERIVIRACKHWKIDFEVRYMRGNGSGDPCEIKNGGIVLLKESFHAREIQREESLRTHGVHLEGALNCQRSWRHEKI